jgi:AcrR family transcriptional regulator
MTTALLSRSTGVDRRVTDAALALFDRHGYNGVDELDIALRAGITMSALKERFVDKQEVLGTILDTATDLLFWQPVDVEGLAPRIAVDRLMREHLRLIDLDRRLARVVVREHRHLENPYRRSWATRTEAYRERWLAAVPDLPAEDAQIAVIAALGALNTAAHGPADAARDDRLVTFAMAFFTR